MADEITVTARLQAKNGSLDFIYPASSNNFSFDQTAVGGASPGYLTIGTTEESEAFSELSTEGWCIMQNLDTTNYVEWGFSTGVYGGRLEAGELALFRLNPSTTMYLKANTAACKVAVYALED